VTERRACARGKQRFRRLFLACRRPRSARLWMWEQLGGFGGVSGVPQRKTTGSQSGSSGWSRLMPVGGRTVPDWQYSKPRAPFLWFLQKTVGFPPAAQGSACQRSRAGGEGWALTPAGSNCARACVRHSQEFLPATWARCPSHVTHLCVLHAYHPAHPTENKHPRECALAPRCLQGATRTRAERALAPRSPGAADPTQRCRHAPARPTDTGRAGTSVLPHPRTHHAPHIRVPKPHGEHPRSPTQRGCCSGQRLPRHGVCDWSDATICGSHT